MLADSSSESLKVGNYSEQDFNSSETTVHSEIVTVEIEQNDLKNEARDCILQVDKPGCKAVTSTDPSSDLNDSQICPYSSVLSTDCSEIRSPTLEASKRESVCLDSQEIPLVESGKTHQESSHTPAPVVSAAVSKLGEKVSENANAGLVQITMSGSKDKPILEVNRGKSTTAKGKKKRREVLQKADAAGTTSDLYMAYKGPNEKLEPTISSESVDSMSGIDARQVSLDFKEKDVRASKEDGQSEAEPDDWEDAADIASPKLKISD
ncbi:hypothetical protein L1049_027186 [Liquidambar formosana]|uniref:Uncharacterized protein n=1 Tax=Liquidambar formosana TaxID=63359 RepID=A0AAP0N5F9_LIQFO